MNNRGGAGGLRRPCCTSTAARPQPLQPRQGQAREAISPPKQSAEWAKRHSFRCTRARRLSWHHHETTRRRADRDSAVDIPRRRHPGEPGVPSPGAGGLRSFPASYVAGGHCWPWPAPAFLPVHPRQPSRCRKNGWSVWSRPPSSSRSPCRLQAPPGRALGPGSCGRPSWPKGATLCPEGAKRQRRWRRQCTTWRGSSPSGITSDGSKGQTHTGPGSVSSSSGR